MEFKPSQTLYINNINEKTKIDVLKKMLYMMFSQYGKVVDLIAKKGTKLRGQAWVVFADVSAATNALRGKQGFSFYGKPMKIQYAKNKSDAAARADGTFDIRLKVRV
jgi:RNA recognition motif-containing protein